MATCRNLTSEQICNTLTKLNLKYAIMNATCRPSSTIFAEVTARGINLVVVRAQLDYHRSLVSGDAFCVRSLLRRVSRLRFEFQQDIFRLPDETLMLSASITGTSLNTQGRPFVPELLQELFSED